MENGRKKEVIEQFDRIAALPEAWNHNRHYIGYMLERLPERPSLALDVGCGSGDYCRALAPRCGRVVGIDVSPNMVRQAELRGSASNVEYRVQSAEECLAGAEEEYDAIVSVAALHHLDMESFFSNAKAALKPNGVLMVLDLFKPSTAAEYALSAAAMPVNLVYSLAKLGRIGPSAAEKAAWADHSRYDVYDTLGGIRAAASRRLGPSEIKPLLFWRYSLYYRKPSA